MNGFGAKDSLDELEKLSQRSITSLKPTNTGKRTKALLKTSEMKDTRSERNDKVNGRLREQSNSSAVSSSIDSSSLDEEQSTKGAGKLTPQVNLKRIEADKQFFSSAKKGSTQRQTPIRESAFRRLDDDEKSETSMRSTTSYRSFDNKSQHSAISAYLPITSRIH